jgi:hypothetical protein
MDKSMSFREIKESELAEEASTSGHSGEENSLASMFSLSKSPTINEANMEIVLIYIISVILFLLYSLCYIISIILIYIISVILFRK